MKREITEALERVLERCRQELVLRVRDPTSQVESHEETFLDVLKGFENLVKATASGHEPAITGALQAVFKSFMNVVGAHQETGDRLGGELIALGALRDQAVADLAEARAHTARTIALRDRELERLREQFARIESMVLGGGDKILSSLREFSVGLATKLDTLLRDGRELCAVSERIGSDADHELPDIAQRVSNLENRAGALSARAAPLLAREFELTAHDLTILEEALRDLGSVHSDYETLCGMVAEFKKMHDAIQTRIAKWSDEWLVLRQHLGAAETLFPHLLGETFFSFAGTSAEVMSRKRKLCGEAALDIKRAVATADKVLAARDREFTDSLERTRVRRDELERLRTLLDQPWLTERTTDEQEHVRIMVLTFRTPTEFSSTPKLRRMLTSTLQRETLYSEEELSGLLDLPLFDQSGAAKFKRYKLTERGHYWRARWQRERPDLVEAVERGHLSLAAWEAEEARRQEEERIATQARAEAHRERREAEETETERAAVEREAARHDPVRIRGKLTQLEKEILQALSLLPVLPGARDAVGWGRILAGAHVTRLVATREKPSLLTIALVKLIMFEPPLFEGRRDGQNVRLVFSPTGQTVYRLLFTPQPEQVAAFEELIAKDPRLWDPQDLEYRRLMERACINEMRRVPTDRLKP